MIKKITKHFLIFCLFFLLSCGFKVVDKTKQNNFSVANIDTSGDRRINYIIKNNLSINARKNSQNLLNIELNSSKKKEVKEKNIKNQITKYKISILVQVKFNLINSRKIHNITSSYSGDYIVADSHSSTISNEKKLVENLVENISEDIKGKINSIINDI